MATLDTKARSRARGSLIHDFKRSSGELPLMRVRADECFGYDRRDT